MIRGHPAGLVEKPTSAIRILVSGWSVLWVGLRFAVESLPKGVVLGRCFGGANCANYCRTEEWADS
jgi:hypothetical protein